MLIPPPAALNKSATASGCTRQVECFEIIIFQCHGLYYYLARFCIEGRQNPILSAKHLLHTRMIPENALHLIKK